MLNPDMFIGKWILDVALNNYETPNAPKKGTYTISKVSNDILRFDMEWISFDDQNMEASYLSHIDGKKHPYENPEIADFTETTLISEKIMQTCTYKDGHLTSKGLRELSDDNNDLHIIQQYLTPDGHTISNRSVYHRSI